MVRIQKFIQVEERCFHHNGDKKGQHERDDQDSQISRSISIFGKVKRFARSKKVSAFCSQRPVDLGKDLGKRISDRYRCGFGWNNFHLRRDPLAIGIDDNDTKTFVKIDFNFSSHPDTSLAILILRNCNTFEIRKVNSPLNTN